MDQTLVCEVCQKEEFSGPVPARQHFESKSHKECVRKKDLEIRQGPSLFSCVVCHVSCNSFEMLQKHYASPRHLERVKRGQILNQYHEAHANSQNDSVHSPNSTNVKDYDFDGTRGYCYVCEVELTSPATADQHINGEKHRKNKERQQQESFGSNDTHKRRLVTFQSTASSQEVMHAKSCNACGVNFSSPINADQHFASERHKKKVASLQPVTDEMNERNSTFSLISESESSYFPTENLVKLSPAQGVVRHYNKGYEFDGKSGWCSLCSVALTSQQNAHEHLNGAKHKKNIAKSSGGVSVMEESSKRFEEKNEFVFNGGRGKCFVCDVELTSEKNAKDHLSGSKHAKAVQRRKDTKGDENVTDEFEMHDNRGYCNVCKLELTSNEHAKQHLSGKPHAKAKVAWEGKRQSGSHVIRTVSFGTAATSSGTQLMPQRLELTESMEAQSPQKVGNGVDMNSENCSQFQFSQDSASNDSMTCMKLGQNIPLLIDGKPEYTFEVTTGFCNVCDLHLTSQEHALQHLNGKKHKKSQQRQVTVEKKEDVDSDHFCKLCKVPFSGQESAMQHYSCEKHIKREQMMKTIPVESSGESASVHTTFDNTTWYPCRLCGCYLNSKEQLEIHEESPKHKAAMDGLSSIGLQETLLVHGKGSTGDRMVRIIRETTDDIQTTGSFDNSRSVTYSSQQYYTAHDTTKNNSTSDGSKFDSLKFDTCGDLDPTSFHNDSIMVDRRVAGNPADFDQTALKQVPDENLSSAYDSCYYSNQNRNIFPEKVKEKDINKPSIFTQLSESSRSRSSHSSNSRDSYASSFSSTVDPDKERQSGIKSKSNILTSQTSLETGGSGPSSSDSDRMPSLEPIQKSGTDDEMPALEPITKSKKDLENISKKSSTTRKKKEREEVKITTQSHIPQGRKIIDESDLPRLEELSHEKVGSGGANRRRGGGSDSARALRNRSSKHGSRENEDQSGDSSSESKVELDKDRGGRADMKSATAFSRKLKESSTEAGCTSSKMATEKTVSENYQYYCKTCKVPMDTQKTYEDHLRGRLHRQKLARMPAPDRRHKALVKCLATQFAQQVDLTKTCPRGYQWELFHKMMFDDRICFLPTGTGKTLVACMAISAMLVQNSGHQVLFLVNKVLLVLQQSKYIKEQIGDKIYRRFDPDDPTKTVERKLKIAELCGGQQSTGGVPLWKHDIIVTTAAFCENMLRTEALRWEDQCLVIFDESHHCTKNHPYNNLMSVYHNKMAENSRCKVVGLTASPAGKKNYSMTVDMLRQLQVNMGDSKIVIVEKETEELQAYMSNAEISTAVTQSTTTEAQFERDLKVYLLQCYMRLAAESNITEHSDLGLTGISKMSLSLNDLQRYSQDLTADVLEELEGIVNMAKPKVARADKSLEVTNLIGHIKFICMVVNVASEIGLRAALKEIQELMATNLNQGFEFARQIGLPCEDILHSIEMQLNLQMSKLQPSGLSMSPEVSSSVSCLINLLTDGKFIQWNQASRQHQPIVLVLVKQRTTATILCETLKSHPDILQKKLAVEKIVGHGAGAAERGMSVAQQRKTLEDIKSHKYNVIIATAVAEEGIDLPECELVVSMNPPSTMTALVQMRGRARKKDSHFVIVCNDSKEQGKLDDLLSREENMIKAAKFLVQNQNRQLSKEAK